MDGSIQIPEWLGAAIIGAVIAALGYVAKLVIQWITELRSESRTRRARLVELLSLLKAGQTAFNIQCEQREKLSELIENRETNRVTSYKGYEELFTKAYDTMNDSEKELHSIIQGVTMYTLKPLNDLTLKWLQEDTYFKAVTKIKDTKPTVNAVLAKQLLALEAHLYLWHAKYNTWIPDKPAHSLVYLADEKRHGVGFPDDIEDDVQNVLKKS